MYKRGKEGRREKGREGEGGKGEGLVYSSLDLSQWTCVSCPQIQIHIASEAKPNTENHCQNEPLSLCVVHVLALRHVRVAYTEAQCSIILYQSNNLFT